MRSTFNRLWRHVAEQPLYLGAVAVVLVVGGLYWAETQPTDTSWHPTVQQHVLGYAQAVDGWQVGPDHVEFDQNLDGGKFDSDVEYIAGIVRGVAPAEVSCTDLVGAVEQMTGLPATVTTDSSSCHAENVGQLPEGYTPKKFSGPQETRLILEDNELLLRVEWQENSTLDMGLVAALLAFAALLGWAAADSRRHRQDNSPE